MEKEEIFTNVQLPTGASADIIEGKGRHYFFALSKSKGDQGLLIKYLINQLVQINGRNISESEIDNMHMRDISYLGEVISTMLSNEYPQ